MKKEKLNINCYFILLITVLCFTLVQFTRFIWPPIMETVGNDLNMNMSQAAKYMGAFYFGYIITMIPAGYLADRFGIKYLLSFCILLAGLSTILMGTIGNYYLGFFYRFLGGFASGAVYSCCCRSIVDWFPPKRRGAAFGALMVGPSLGIILANVLMPSLLNIVNWQLTFIYCGIFISIFAVFLFFFLKKIRKEEKSNINFLKALKFVFGHKNLRLIAFAGFFLLWSQMSLVIFANKYIQSLGFSVKQAGLVMVFYGIGAIVGSLSSGIISDKISSRKLIMLSSYLLSIPLTIIFAKQSNIINFSYLAFILGIISYAANPHLSVYISEFAGQKLAAVANGGTSFCFQMAPLFVPMLLGYIYDIRPNYYLLWFLIAIGPLFGAICLFFLKDKIESS